MERICQQHRALETLAAQLEAIVAQPSPPDKGLAQLRLAMSTQLREHLQDEERRFFGPLRSEDDVRALILESDRELLAMRMRYSDHVVDWPPERVAREWTAYGAEVRALVAGLRRRIRHEEGVVFPALTSRAA